MAAAASDMLLRTVAYIQMKRRSTSGYLFICASLDYAARYGLTLQGASAFARISSEGRACTSGVDRDQHRADLGEHRQTCVLGLGQNLYTDFAPSHSSQT
jgi:hypothetical protein